jgi:pyruvate ferredoxin oxidoreductase beta subunit
MVEGGRGAVTPTHILTRKPVEEYLKLQGRFRHLFEPTRQDEAIRHIQERVDAYWKQVNG